MGSGPLALQIWQFKDQSSTFKGNQALIAVKEPTEGDMLMFVASNFLHIFSVFWHTFNCIFMCFIRGKQGNCKSGNYFVFWARDFLTTWRKQCPFNNNIAVIDGGIYEHLLSTLAGSMSLPTYSWACSLVNQMTVSSVMCPPVLEVDYGKRIKFSTFSSHDCTLQTFWAPLDSREAGSRRPIFFADSSARFEDIKVCINGFSQSLHLTH